MDEQKAQGTPYPMQWNGKEYRLGLITQDVKAKFTAACKSNAISEFEELQAIRYSGELANAQEAKRQDDERNFRLDMTSGLYRWGGRAANNWRNSQDGMACLVRLLCEAGGTPIPLDDVTAFIADAGELLGRTVNAILWDSEAPKAKRPVEKTEKQPTGPAV